MRSTEPWRGDEMTNEELRNLLKDRHDELLLLHEKDGGKVFAGWDFEEADSGIEYEDGCAENVPFFEYATFIDQYSTGADMEDCPYVESTDSSRRVGRSNMRYSVATATSIFGDEVEEQSDDWAMNNEFFGLNPVSRRWIVFPSGVSPFDHLSKLAKMLQHGE